MPPETNPVEGLIKQTDFNRLSGATT